MLTALAVSGLPTDRFTFEGFLPRKQGERLRRFRALVDEPRTMVFFESPNRSPRRSADIVDRARRRAPRRRVPRAHEAVRGGAAAARPPSCAEWAAAGVKGEIVLVVAGRRSRSRSTLEDGVAQVLELVADGTRLKEASAEIAEATGLVASATSTRRRCVAHRGCAPSARTTAQQPRGP